MGVPKVDFDFFPVTNAIAISFEGISKTFRGRQALKEISFSVRRGEIFGLLGHNGAGKSTTFGIALGHIHADSGHVRIFGCDVATERSRALTKTGAIFETPAFYEYLSGWRNLEFYVSLSGRVTARQLFDAIRLVGLEERIHDPVRTYSHGMRQRLALALALLPEPELVLLDEPTEGLDPAGIHEIRSLILRLRKERGITFLISSHLLHEVELLCDRIAILHRGRMVFCGEWRQTDAPAWRISTPDTIAAARVLERCGGTFSEEGIATFNCPPEDALAMLVREGVRVREFRPVECTLERFYLEHLQKARKG